MIVIVNKKKKDAHIVSIEKPKTLGYLLIAGTHGFKLGNMFRGFFLLLFFFYFLTSEKGLEVINAVHSRMCIIPP